MTKTEVKQKMENENSQNVGVKSSNGSKSDIKNDGQKDKAEKIAEDGEYSSKEDG